MKNLGHEQDAVCMPPERPADELLSDPVRNHLQQRKQNTAAQGSNLAQLLMSSPLTGANLDLERRKDLTRPLDL